MDGCGVSTPTVLEEVDKLVRAVNVALCATVSAEARAQAYVLCEKFKEESPLCAAVGFHLAAPGRDSACRHFGLQLVEHCIKFRWNGLDQAEKLSIKDSVWRIIQDGTSVTDTSYVKDGSARLVVEMAKREWPQHWPEFLQELTWLARSPGGESRTELVMLVLLRLTEDVAVFQTVESPTRRRDLLQSLTANMGDLMDFLSQLLEAHTTEYRKCCSSTPEDPSGTALHGRLVLSILTTLQVHVDWVSINHIMAHEGKLLEQFCTLLSEESLRLAAAECLLQVAGRKGALKERKPLLILYSHGAISCMLQAAELAACQPLAEANYAFLKRLAEVLVALGTQLCSLYGSKEQDVTKPATLPLFLQALLALLRHPSLSINLSATTLWLSMLRHEQLSTDADLVSILPAWMFVVAGKLMKVGYPSSNDNAACSYSRLDFEGDEDFAPALTRFRADLLDCVRYATVISPAVTYECARSWLVAQLDKPAKGAAELHEGAESSSPALLEWEALIVLLDVVIGKVSIIKEPAELVRQVNASGFQLLDRCLRYSSNDPLVLSALLSCISALFVFIKHDPSRLQSALDKIFTAMMFSLPGQSKDCRSRPVRNVRRHACSLLVKISRQMAPLLLPVFDYMRSKVDELWKASDPDAQLSRMERVTLQEALLIVSNNFHNYEAQAKFIELVLQPAAEQWTGPAINGALATVADFMAYVGLDRPPVEPSTDDVNGRNRSELLFCTNVFLAVVKRSRRPDDPDVARAAGFFDPRNGRLCHPMAGHFEPLLFNIFRLARMTHALWEPQERVRVSQGYVNSYDMLESEVMNTLGQAVGGGGAVAGAEGGAAAAGVLDAANYKQQSPLERMQQFLTQLHFNVFQLLGSLAEQLADQFYDLQGLAVGVAGTACYCVDQVPDYRFRHVMRLFCKPFVVSCPARLQEAVLMPFLAHLCPAVLGKLTARWHKVMQAACGHQDDDNQDLREVVDDMLARQLTKDYLDVLKAVLFAGEAAAQVQRTAPDDQEMMDDSCYSSDTMSDLGRCVLTDESVFQSVIQCILSGLWWPDTSVSMKATLLFGPIVKYWATRSDPSQQQQQRFFPTADITCHYLINVVNGLQIHGQHDSNQGPLIQLAVLVYDTFRPMYPVMAQVLLQYTQCTAQDLAGYEEKAFANSTTKNQAKSERVKREMFRKLAARVIGKNVSELFRKPVELARLPAVKKLTPRVQDAVDGVVGLDLLFSEENV